MASRADAAASEVERFAAHLRKKGHAVEVASEAVRKRADDCVRAWRRSRPDTYGTPLEKEVLPALELLAAAVDELDRQKRLLKNAAPFREGEEGQDG